MIWDPPEHICPYCHRTWKVERMSAKRRIPALTKNNREEVLAMVREAIERAGGNKSAAARDLGVAVSTVFRLVRKM